MERLSLLHSQMEVVTHVREYNQRSSHSFPSHFILSSTDQHPWEAGQGAGEWGHSTVSEALQVLHNRCSCSLGSAPSKIWTVHCAVLLWLRQISLLIRLSWGGLVWCTFRDHRTAMTLSKHRAMLKQTQTHHGHLASSRLLSGKQIHGISHTSPHKMTQEGRMSYLKDMVFWFSMLYNVQLKHTSWIQKPR